METRKVLVKQSTVTPDDVDCKVVSDASSASSQNSQNVTVKGDGRGRPKSLTHDMLSELINSLLLKNNEVLKHFVSKKNQDLKKHVVDKIDSMHKDIYAKISRIDARVSANEGCIEGIKKDVSVLANRVQSVSESANVFADLDGNISAIYKEVEERNSRKSSVIIHASKEVVGDNYSHRLELEKAHVVSIADAYRDLLDNGAVGNPINQKMIFGGNKSFDKINKQDIFVRRFGLFSPASNKPRLLNVKFKNKHYSLPFIQAFNTLRKENMLPNDMKDVWVSVDLTIEQLKQKRTVMKELDQRIKEGEKNLLLRLERGVYKIAKKRSSSLKNSLEKQ